MRIFLSLFFALALAIPQTARAEYRAYLLEVYDQILGKQWEAATGFTPDQYLNTHGGGNRLSTMIKATWMCYGDRSRYQPVCKMPPPKDPKIEVGDQVEITLDKHMTQGWKGTVELGLWRQDLKSNVYGVRFGERKDLYGRYFEFDLKLTKKKSEGVEVQRTEEDAPPAAAVEGAPENLPAVAPPQ